MSKITNEGHTRRRHTPGECNHRTGTDANGPVKSEEGKEEGVEGVGGERCARWLALWRGTSQVPKRRRKYTSRPAANPFFSSNCSPKCRRVPRKICSEALNAKKNTGSTGNDILSGIAVAHNTPRLAVLDAVGKIVIADNKGDNCRRAHCALWTIRASQPASKVKPACAKWVVQGAWANQQGSHM